MRVALVCAAIVPVLLLLYAGLATRALEAQAPLTVTTISIDARGAATATAAVPTSGMVTINPFSEKSGLGGCACDTPPGSGECQRSNDCTDILRVASERPRFGDLLLSSASRRWPACCTVARTEFLTP